MIRSISHLLLSGFSILLFQLTFAGGNAAHLFPMSKTNISLQKEIIDIAFVEKKGFLIKVHYEFFNPGPETSLDIGFETKPPYKECDGPVYEPGKHGEINEYKVILNDAEIYTTVSIVKKDKYYKNGQFIIPAFEKVLKDYGPYVYMFHFRAGFRKGLNIITNSYYLTNATNEDYFYHLVYDLDKAKKWKGSVIADLTVKINVGAFKYFNISRDFNKNSDIWKINGVGYKNDTFYEPSMMRDEITNKVDDDTFFFTQFILRSGGITFQMKNFIPQGNLYVFDGESGYYDYSIEPWDHERWAELFFQIEFWRKFDTVLVYESSSKILKSLPYARRGYISPDKEIQEYFDRMEWYRRDPDYVANEASLTEEERKWLKNLVIVKG